MSEHKMVKIKLGRGKVSYGGEDLGVGEDITITHTKMKPNHPKFNLKAIVDTSKQSVRNGENAELYEHYDRQVKKLNTKVK